MKKFLSVTLIVLLAVGVLAACAPVENFKLDDLSDVTDYVRTLPTWVVIAGAIVLFFIGFGIIWKLIPGFIKVIALIALVAVLAGVAYGLLKVPFVDDVINGVDDILHPSATVTTSVKN